MAKKIEPMHTKDVLEFNIVPDPEDVKAQQERYSAGMMKRYAQNDTAIYTDMLKTYEEFSTQFDRGTDDERIMLLTRLNQVKEFSGWMIGDFLIRIEDEINHGSRRGYFSISDYLLKNEALLGFGKSAGFAYMAARKAVTMEQFKRLGIKKTSVVATIPDPVRREEIIAEIASRPKTTEAEVRQIVAEYRETVKAEKAAEKQAEIKAINKIVGCDVYEKKDHVQIKPKHQEHTPYFYMAVMKYLPQIKAEAKRQADRDE